MVDIFDQLDTETPSEEDIFDTVTMEKPDKDRTPKAILKGFTKGAPKSIANILDILSPNAIPNYIMNLLGSKAKTAAQQLAEPAEKFIGEKLEPYSPATEETRPYEEFGQRYSEYAPYGPISGLLMAGAGQLAKESGAGEGGQLISELLAGIGPQLAGKIVSNIPKALKATKVLTKEGLALPKVAEKSPKLLRPTAFKGSKEKAMKSLSNQVESLFEKSKMEKIPLAKKGAKGLDIDRYTNQMMERVDKMASLVPEEVTSNNSKINSFLKEFDATLHKGKMLTPEEKLISKRVKDAEAAFHPMNNSSAKDLVDQYRKNNKELKKIYDEFLIHGKQTEKKNFLEGLNRAIAEEIETSFNEYPTLKNSFKKANIEYRQKKQLDSLNEFLKASEVNGEFDADKFSKIINTKGGKRRITNALGKEEFQKFTNMAEDIKRAKKGLAQIKDLKLTGKLAGNAVLGSLLKYLGLGKLIPVKLGIETLNLARGTLMTKPQVQRNVRLLLKNISSGNKKAIIPLLEKIAKDLPEEKD